MLALSFPQIVEPFNVMLRTFELAPRNLGDNHLGATRVPGYFVIYRALSFWPRV